MDEPNLPSLGLGFEFEWWEAALYDDLADKDYPFKGYRKFKTTGTIHTGEKPDDEVLTGNYDDHNPAPDGWNPNKFRMPPKEVVNEMLGSLRKTIADALISEPAAMVSDLDKEHPGVVQLENGVSSAFTKYTAHRDDGRERNLAEKPRHWRKDTHVFERIFYFVALEMRTKVFTEANKKEGDQMRKELGLILKEIPKNHNVSVNAGNDALYINEKSSLPQPGEARAGMHIHVSAAGVFDTVTEKTDANIMGKRIIASKKLLTLYWLVEPDIMKLHASWRSRDSRYAGLLRRHSNLAFSLSKWVTSDTAIEPHWGYEAEEAENKKNHHYNEVNFDNDQGQWSQNDLGPVGEKVKAVVQLRGDNAEQQRTQRAIEKIWMCKNMDQLVWLCSSHFGNRRGAISLNQLLATDSQYKGGGVREAAQRLGTVEFRAMQGSFNYDAVVAWSEVVMQMTEPCVTQNNDGGFVDFVARVLEAPESGDPVKAFMKRLGFDENHHAYKFYNQNLQKDVFDEEAKPRFDRNSIPNVFVGQKGWCIGS
ncbi:hypothetical protein PG999_003289 [Apiospora kogelbergensis]|uniref:Amidoligase enzyme n=1 Tax=Apiospora kogelbergensis TaxID=1337665 RepID=A0AAW0R373_9PEZI